MAFVNLHNQTQYSILDSILTPKLLFNKAKELGQNAVAVTDHGTLAAAWSSLKASKDSKVKLLMGLESYFKFKIIYIEYYTLLILESFFKNDYVKVHSLLYSFRQKKIKNDSR